MSGAPAGPLLEIEGLDAFYGGAQVLFDMSLRLGPGEVVALMGRNGAGKSTTLKAIMGLVERRARRAAFAGSPIGRLAPYRIARLGLGYVPEDRSIFPSLTVRQNLVLGQKGAREGGRWSMRDMFAIFPRLEERADVPAGVLSGGEQQMLTLCRTLMGDPSLVMIDEPTEGLAPKIVEQVANLFREIKKRGVSILLVEQKLTIALRISQRLYVMGHGQIVFEGTPQELRANEAVRKEWLEV